MDRKSHWENIYATKALTDVSWHQLIPTESLEYIHRAGIPKNAAIIDIGGGDSYLADHLIDLGYQDLTVLDISARAIGRAKERLQEKAQLVNWIVTDITEFKTEKKYNLWHDRAAFHFLRDEDDQIKYREVVEQQLISDGHLIIGTFSQDGPTKCSGIEIQQYSFESMNKFWQKGFDLQDHKLMDHTTPTGKIQNFLFSYFKKKN